MELYKEEVVAGTSYERPKVLHFANELGQPPVATILEERITQLNNGQVIKEPVGTLTAEYDPVKSFQLRKSADNSLTGEVMTHTQFYDVVYSFYRSEAEARDAALAEAVAVQEP
ncbi:MAG: hypothetical protein QX198_04590 [Methylococcaceae bacterium]